MDFLKDLKLWLFELSKTTFLMAILVKMTLGNILMKSEKIRQGGGVTIPKQLKYFTNADNSTTLTPPESKSSTEFKFGGLVC